MKEDADEKNEPFKLEGEQTVAFKPDVKSYVRVHDKREEMAQDSEKYAPSSEQRQAFYQRRIDLIQLSDALDAEAGEVLQDLRESALKEGSDTEPEDAPSPRPIPGGVGYGAFYRDGKLQFNDSSVLHYSIVTIRDVGDDSNKWLYLTSTNRSPKGVEAYVSYRGNDEPTFTIFDWSKAGDARWVLSRPYGMLGDYLTQRSAGGNEYDTIYVANSTRRVAGTTWRNEVMLYNKNTMAFDLIYSNDYDLPPSNLHKYLNWGPIVETFAPFPYTTNVVGFFDAQLLQDGAAPCLLTDEFTWLRKDHAHHPGFDIVFNQPNYTFLVRWTD